MTPNPKRKSQRRFEQANDLTDRIGPTLPSSAYLALLFVAWRHAHGRDFSVSSRQFAIATNASHRHVRTMLDDLEKAGVIELKKERQGTIPRTYRFTGKTFTACSSGAPRAPLTQNLVGYCTTPSGELHDT